MRREGGEPPLWQLVALADYARPERPTGEAVRTGLLGLFRRKKDSKDKDEPLVDEEGLLPLPPDLLEAVAPWPDWRQVVPALDRGLGGFDEAGGNAAFHPIAAHPIAAIVGAPYSGVREGLRCWAQQHGWPVIEAPAREHILGQDTSWREANFSDPDREPDQAPDERPPILIPELEHCFLRHPRGLDFLRRLLDRLHRSSRRCVVATNSWAWSYLNAAVGIADAVAPPLTFQAFDAGRLARWFLSLQTCAEPVTFCRAQDGSVLLAPLSETGEEATSERGTGAELTRLLAGYSRGIAGVAWAVWRRSLCRVAAEDAADRLEEAAADISGPVVYVRPWSGIGLRSLPSGTDLPDLLLLHALLIHGGLTEALLPEILPSIGGSVPGRLHKLGRRGIVEHHQGRWQVTPLGYPATREALASEGLLVDPL